MKRLCLLVLPALVGTVPAAHAGGALHGTVVTDRGDRFTGPIRWDHNENFWDDVLDATKDREIRTRKRGSDVRIFGIRISGGGRETVVPRFSIPFGHIRAIENGRRGKARIELKNGDVLQIEEGADLGGSMRGIVVGDDLEGQVELNWGAVDRVEFSAAPDDSRDAERLYGTVETRSGRFTGYVVWDRDEALLDDMLDGEDEGRDYRIPFRKIASITRRGSRSSEIALDGGRVLELSGTNDVNDENRGIDITIPGTGLVQVPWEEFVRVEFLPAPPSRSYDEFDGGSRLWGTVVDRAGRTMTGAVTWDRDEEYTWEPLDGEIGGIEFAIPFENVLTIRRLSGSSAEVVLRSGERLELRDSNDVDDENKGILVRLEDGTEASLEWDDLDHVRFAGP